MLTYIFMYIYVYVCGKEGRKTEKKTCLLAHGQGADGMRYNSINRNYCCELYS